MGGFFNLFFYHWSGKQSSKSIKTNQQKQNYQKHNCMCGLGDYCDGIVSSVQLGNASAPVKPASWLISPDYCLSILSALLTSPHTTPSPHHLPSLLTSLFPDLSIHCLHQSGLKGLYRCGFSKMTKGFLFLMLLKTWFQRGFQMGAIHFYEVTIDWIVGLMLLLYFIRVKWHRAQNLKAVFPTSLLTWWMWSTCQSWERGPEIPFNKKPKLKSIFPN